MAALPGFLNRLFDSNARDIARCQTVVAKINALEPQIQKLSNEQLKQRIAEIRQQIQTDYARLVQEAGDQFAELIGQERREQDRKMYDPLLDAVLPEVFAITRESARRTLGMRHYDVQMIGGMVLHDGRIAEMRTGEGKTLVGTSPLVLNALLGKGAHLVTANDYLSRRDAIWNAPVYHLLGLSVGIIQGQSPETGDEGGSYIYDPDYDDPDPRFRYARPCTRHEAYMCDITYGTNNEFGFDYLRDNMEFTREELRQRELHFAIVDEVDSILIDEARTPLIISGMVQQPTDMYETINRIVARMKRGIDDPVKDKDNPEADKLKSNIHYVVDEKQKTATITDAGVAMMERELNISNLSENNELMHYLQAAMKAHGVFRKDIDYVVKTVNEEDGPEIIIVDENTGRLMFGRRYSDGLHQAIEAKEKVTVKSESQTLATITFQNYFRLYSKLSGMTGTAKTEEDEFRKIYALDVVQVPTNRPMVRQDQADVIYKTLEHKLRGITAEILRVYCRKQPILVGTRSIEMSERVSQRLAPAPLAALCMIEVAREALENTKNISSEEKKQFTNLLNGALMNGMQLRTPVSRLKPLLQQLSLREDPLDAANMKAMERIFRIEPQGEELLREALLHGIGHNVLNAKFHEQEAVIISEAGRKGAVTISTNMAGRGVDILLGGKHIDQELPPVDGRIASLEKAVAAAEALEQEEKDIDESALLGYRRFGNAGVLNAVTTGALTDEEHKKAADEVRQLGGLYILGTERHESRRIDNQLRGRAGRQGDPGESRFYVSLEDELWRLFGDKANHPLLRTWEEHLAMDAKMLSSMIQRAQKKVEEHYFESRKHVLDYDDVMNRQRELIYRERRRILEGVDLRDTIVHYISANITSAIDTYCNPDIAPGDWQMDTLYQELNDYFLLAPAVMPENLQGKPREEMSDYLTTFVMRKYEEREKEFEEIAPGEMRQMERWMALRAINDRWMQHLANMDYLREGIGLRGYEQVDPLLIYQREAFDEFERMQQAVQDDIVRALFRVQLVVEPQDMQGAIAMQNLAQPIPLPQNLPRPKLKGMEELQSPTLLNVQENGQNAAQSSPARSRDGAPPDWKGGRNDLCWCGSGLKYKKCHGR